MTEIIDFLSNALPWIAIGLFVAISCVRMQAKKDGKGENRLLNGISWFSVGCFLFLAILEMYSGNQSSGTTWLVLGVINAVFNFANTQKKRKNKIAAVPAWIR